jgi:hypothetical protein
MTAVGVVELAEQRVNRLNSSTRYQHLSPFVYGILSMDAASIDNIPHTNNEKRAQLQHAPLATIDIN